ncbi:ATP-grasp domain-containing protein [Robbsia andropogonis]|uniref:ATP-grasp domain-containing protein n=1 Tax=Robbsia andropogonis TaxID=28092 RepID=UPI000686F8B9|nr:ATP-grasp domain-containing protein [Robbsia andropogonis]MCP1118460.1 ATP-grasp domain-containing protein [Robbsia andropogonis]MCP1127760.1 ATP-grasp domain-containing protein [Robbsia andropogonis]
MSEELVIVGARATGTSIALVEAAMRRGMGVTILLESGVELDRNVFPKQTEIFNVDTRESAVISWIQERFSHQAAKLYVTTAHDLYAKLAANVAASLGCLGPDAECVTLSISKSAQKRILEEARIPTSPYAVIDYQNRDQTSSLVSALAIPVVVKPSEGSASNGVRLCHSIKDAVEHVALLFESDGGLQEGQVVVESFLSGHEYCVEFFDGVYVGSMRKLKSSGLRFVERGYTAELDLQDITLERMIAVCGAAVAAAGLTWGPVHLDCIVSHDVPHIVELNPRIAGSFICDIVRDAYHFDPVEALLDKLQGQEIRLPNAFKPKRYARVDFFLDEDSPSWDLAEGGNVCTGPLTMRYGPLRIPSRERRAFVYVHGTR